MTATRSDRPKAGEAAIVNQTTAPSESGTVAALVRRLLAGRFLGSAYRLRVGLVYLAIHLLLDWISQRYPDAAPGILPWNPAAGLGIVLVCIYGRGMAFLIPPTVLVSSLLLRASNEAITIAAVEGLIVGIGYAGAALAISGPALAFNSRELNLRDLLVLLFVAVVSSAIVAICYIMCLSAFGGVAVEEAPASVLRYWIGDLIGLTIVAPLGLLVGHGRIEPRPTRLAILQLATTAILLALALQSREAGRASYFFLLFFPIIWIAIASGIEGVVVALASIQAGLLLAAFNLKFDVHHLADFQARMLALTVTGLVAGALVTDRRRAEEVARMQRDALAQIATRASMVELATAIAHEVNQPLSAAGTFASLVVETLESEPSRDPTALESARKVVRQIDRASHVVRGLRALVRLTNHAQAPVAPERILTEVADLCALDANRLGVTVRVNIPAGLPMIRVDRLQVEQAILNLMRNALDAIGASGSLERAITLYGLERPNGAVELGVIDTGPGLPPGFSLDQLRPFTSKKEDGLGVGLSLCRSIGLANGAVIEIHGTQAGAHISLVFDPDRRVQHD